MPDVVIVAIVVGAFGLVSTSLAILGPWLLNRQTAASRVKEKQQDWARQDDVAKAAKSAATAAQSTQKALVTSSRRTRKQLTHLEAQAQEIHGLVNSNLTIQMQNEYDGLIREKAALTEIIRLTKKSGDEPLQETLDAVIAAESKIADLSVNLIDRNRLPPAAVQPSSPVIVAGEL